MSVFGGDSWASEAQYRKRRVEDLVAEGLPDSAFKRLSNGRFTCLVCPNNPVLDSSLMFSMHCKGSRHRASESKLKERELRRQDEIKKRIALSGCSIRTPGSTSTTQQTRLESKPLLGQTRRATAEILCSKLPQQSATYKNHIGRVNDDHDLSRPFNSHKDSGHCANDAGNAVVLVSQQLLDFRELREKELKFTAAGWKRDCHGKWYKDETVEFDSDEEDPNVSLT